MSTGPLDRLDELEVLAADQVVAILARELGTAATRSGIADRIAIDEPARALAASMLDVAAALDEDLVLAAHVDRELATLRTVRVVSADTERLIRAIALGVAGDRVLWHGVELVLGDVGRDAFERAIGVVLEDGQSRAKGVS